MRASSGLTSATCIEAETHKQTPSNHPQTQTTLAQEPRPPLPFLLHNLALLDLLDACRGPSLRHRSFSATLNRSMRTSCRLCGSRILHEGPPRALISPHSARLSTMLSVTQLAAQALFLVFCRPLLPCSPTQVISRSSHSNFARFQPDSSLASPTRASLLRRRRNRFSLLIHTQEVPLD